MVICSALISALLTLPPQHFELKTDKEDFFTNWKLYQKSSPSSPLCYNCVTNEPEEYKEIILLGTSKTRFTTFNEALWTLHFGEFCMLH